MKSLTDCYKLGNGVEIPCVGFGTWQTPDGAVAVSSVKAAIEAGYRHIDTAAAYGNEESVGAAIRQSGVPRKELFITTKLWNDDHGYESTLRAFDLSMKKLGLDYLDLYLIHWPNPVKFRKNWAEANAGTWKAFEELYGAGKIRAIGISNFHGRHIDALLKTASVAPMVNQIRLCPGDTQDAVVDYCRGKDILLEAYSPLGVGEIFKSPEMRVFAEKYQRSIAQICIRWSLQRGYLPLPKSVTPQRILENTGVFDFELIPEDVKAIADLKGIAGTAQDPDKTAF
ncbi:MAG: aldo/keto reductase [Treponema sp.]|jgi:diketogulonate reductase-like aldo/keto reductase|nr:aldo/keto reductase [Treponema sp.]